MTDNHSRSWAPRFFTIWTGQALSLLGSSVAQFAVVWWLTDTTGSAVVLATASLVAMVPQVVLGPFIGALVDRLDRRKVMIVADSAVALLGLMLAVLFWVGRAQVWHLYVIMALRSLGGAFHWPAMQASTTQLVPSEQLPRISGLNQALQGASQIMAPPLGALLLALLPLHGMMGLDVVTAIMAVLPLLFVPIPQPHGEGADAPTGASSVWHTLWADTREGLGYIWNWRALRYLVGTAAILNLLYAPAFTLMPLLVTRYFERGALELGYLQAAWGGGIVVGGLLLLALGDGKHGMRTAVYALVCQGMMLFLLPSSPRSAMWPGVVGLFIAAVMNAIVNGLLMSFMQRQVAPSKQGRVFTALSSFCGAMMPLGMALAGPVAELLGIRVWFIAASIMTVVLGLWAIGSSMLKELEQSERKQLKSRDDRALVAANAE